MSCHELGIFGGDAEVRWGSGIDPRNAVDGIGQPHEVLVPLEVEAIYCVVDWDIARCYFLGQRLLMQVDDRCPEGEVLREVVLRIKTHHRLSLQAVFRLVFEADTHVGATLYDALVEYGHHTHCVIDRIVGVLDQSRASRSDSHRASCHIHCTEVDLCSTRCRVFTFQAEFVLLCYLLSLCQCAVIELLIAVSVGKGIAAET